MMKPAFNINRLIETELHYAKRFTTPTARPWGILYWNEGNRESHDSNHAVITDFLGLEKTLKEIVSFYKAKGMEARLYPSLKENELALLSPHLASHGFELTILPNEYLLHEKESTHEPIHGIFFDRLQRIGTDLTELVRTAGYGEWAIKLLERHLRHPGYHLLGGFVNEELVTIASVNIFEGYSRVDDILTHKFYRNKGYSGAMLHHLVEYHAQHSQNHLYMYTPPIEGSQVYEKAGFVKIPYPLQAWEAVRPLS